MEKKMEIRRFLFGESQETKDPIAILTPEIWDGDYGLYTWPAAPVLAQYIHHHQEKMRDKHVLELGSGTALAGMMAAKCGARVTLSDGEHLDECMENCRRSCELNEIDLPVLGLTWGEFTESLVKLDRVDYVIASDCFYSKRDFDPVMLTVSYILEKNPGCEFWCSYQERSANKSLEYHLKKYGMTCRQVALASFGADNDDIAGNDLPGRHTISMLVMTKL